MNPAVFQPGGPGGEEEEEEGSFHTRISPPTPPFLTYLYMPNMESYLDTFGTSFFRLLCFFFSHHTDWIDGIVSYPAGGVKSVE